MNLHIIKAIKVIFLPSATTMAEDQKMTKGMQEETKHSKVSNFSPILLTLFVLLTLRICLN